MSGCRAIVRRELLTSLRAKWACMTLLALVAVLSVILVTAWPQEVHLVSVRSQIARLLFGTFAAGQVLMMAILATVFSAGSMTVEKERNCLDFLMTAPLSPFTIMLGKLLSSITYIVLLLVATMPLASVCLFLGGIATGDIVQFYIAVFCFAAFCGLIGFACSTFFNRTQAALAVSLMIVVPFCLVWLALSDWGTDFGAVFLSVPAVLTWGLVAFCLVVSVSRRMRKPFPKPARSIDEEDPDEQKGLVLTRRRFPDRLLLPKRRTRPLPDRGNPVYYKEVGCEIFGSGSLLVRSVLLIALMLVAVFLCFLIVGRHDVFFAYIAAFVMLIAPTFASNAFTGEKERGTLDLLLTTPLRPSQIVWAKVVANLRFTGILVGFLCAYVLFGFLMVDAGLYSRIFPYSAIILVEMISVIAIGLFCSLVFKRSVTSMVVTYTIISLLYLGPVATILVVVGLTDMPARDIAWLGVLSPFTAISALAHPDWKHGSFMEALPAGLWRTFAFIYVSLAAVLVTGMITRFRQWLRQ